ncbi:YcxB family protein [Actinoplanes awajinensis]|uniref:YcxB family protein n=1 Tax=Actinoplanes awajinensis TaxID=135946 RepID=UPI0018DEA7FC|nr:YcxB family protein [Actinoplanes awajinensis]
MDITWQPEKADHRTAVRAALITPARKVAWIILVSFMGLLLAIMLLVALTTGDFHVGYRALAAMAAGVLGPFVLPALLVEMAWRSSPAVRQPARARVDPHVGITFTQGGTSTLHTWAAIGRIRETDTLFLVGLAAHKGINIPLPKRGLTSPAQVEYLRYLFQNFLARN